MGWIKVMCREPGSRELAPCLINTAEVCYVRTLLNGYTEFVFTNEYVRHCEASIDDVEKAILRSSETRKKFES